MTKLSAEARLNLEECGCPTCRAALATIDAQAEKITDLQAQLSNADAAVYGLGEKIERLEAMALTLWKVGSETTTRKGIDPSWLQWTVCEAFGIEEWDCTEAEFRRQARLALEPSHDPA